MEAKYDWLFWLDLDIGSKVLYISQNNYLKEQEFINISFHFKTINADGTYVDLCSKEVLYDAIYIDGIEYISKDNMIVLKNLVKLKGYFIVARQYKNFISNILKKSILKHHLFNEKATSGSLYFRSKEFELYETLYVYPSITMPWTLSNSAIILEEISWWKRSKNFKVIFLQKLFSFSMIAHTFMYFWPDTISLYKKVK